MRAHGQPFARAAAMMAAIGAAMLAFPIPGVAQQQALSAILAYESRGKAGRKSRAYNAAPHGKHMAGVRAARKAPHGKHMAGVRAARKARNVRRHRAASRG